MQHALGQQVWRPRQVNPDLDFGEQLLGAYRANKVFSDENILGSLHDCYSNAPQAIEVINSVGVPIELHVVFRAPIDWHQSAYAQYLQEGNYQLSPSEYFFRQTMSPYYFLNSSLLDLLEQSSNSKLFAYYYSPRGLEALRKALGAPAPLTEVKNRSVSASRQLVMRDLLRITENPALVRYVLQTLVERKGDFTTILDNESRRILRPAVRDWNSNVLSRLIGSEDANHVRFEIPSNTPTAEQKYSDLLEIASYFMAMQHKPRELFRFISFGTSLRRIVDRYRSWRSSL